MEATEKVRPMHSENKGETKQKEPQKTPEQLLAETRKDLGKVALFVSILTVVLLVIFFYSVNQNVSALQGDVEELATLQGEVNGVQGEVSSVQGEVNSVQGEVNDMQGEVASLEKSLSGVSEEVNTLDGKFGDLSGSFDKLDTQVVNLQGDFSSLNSKVGTMGQKLAELENLPETTKAMILSNLISEMTRKANYLSNQVDGEQQKSLHEAKKLLDQVQQGLVK